MSDATGDLPLDPAAEDLEWYRVCSVGEIEDEVTVLRYGRRSESDGGAPGRTNCRLR